MSEKPIRDYDPPPQYGSDAAPAPGYPTQLPPPRYEPTAPQPGVILVSPQVNFQDFPITVTCQNCHATVLTNTQYIHGLLTWICVGLLCLFGCWLGCCLIPLCVDSCRDVIHTCPACNMVVGKYERIK